MGRFFQTADPRFIEDFIYKPPYELMDQVATQRQNQYDKDVEEVALLDDPIAKVQYINDPYEREIVQKKADLYKTKVDELSKKLQSDPLNYQKYMGEINGLKSEISNDLLAGDLSKVQGSYDNYERFLKDNEKNPYKQMALDKLMSDWQKDNNKGSLGKGFGYVKLVDKPDIDLEKVKLEPNKLTFVDGQWINSETGVPQERWQDAAEGLIRSHKDYIPYIQQQQELFGMPGFDLNQTPMFVNIGYRLPNGSMLTSRDFDEILKKAQDPTLTNREKSEIYKQLNGAKPITDVNPYSAWYGEGLTANSKTYLQQDKKPNEVWQTTYKEQQATARNNADNANAYRIAKLNNDTKIKLKGMEDVPNIQRLVDTTVDSNTRLRSGLNALLTKDLGIQLSPNDIKRFENGGGYNVAIEKINSLGISGDKKQALINHVNDIAENAKNSIVAHDEEYKKIFGTDNKTIQSIKNYTTKVMKENPSVFLSRPLMYNGKEYSNKEQLEKAIGKKFTIGQDLTLTSDDGEGGKEQSRIKDKYVINPYTSSIIINDPANIQSGQNLRVMDLTSDDGSVITVYQRYGEFNAYK